MDFRFGCFLWFRSSNNLNPNPLQLVSFKFRLRADKIILLFENFYNEDSSQND